MGNQAAHPRREGVDEVRVGRAKSGWTPSRGMPEGHQSPYPSPAWHSSGPPPAWPVEEGGGLAMPSDRPGTKLGHWAEESGWDFLPGVYVGRGGSPNPSFTKM